MVLLFTYVFFALVFSFLCSIAEAVILSVTTSHIAMLEHQGKPSGALLRTLQLDINRPLAAILTLNTIAHTVGAAGAGAEAAAIFGSAYLGLASGILTLLILVFSEIIPKTLGARYWRALAPATAYSLRYLIVCLYPFVVLSELLTRGLKGPAQPEGLSRGEFVAMADVSAREGQLAEQESTILKNLLRLNNIRVREIMTPRMVVFSLSKDMKVEEYFHRHDQTRFSRIPIYEEDRDRVIGFVLRNDLLLAKARGNVDTRLDNYCREIAVLLETASLSQVFDQLLRARRYMGLVVDEYGSMEGIVTIEDLIETLLGLEIVDEGDEAEDMQAVAKRLWRKRAKTMGFRIEDDS